MTVQNLVQNVCSNTSLAPIFTVLITHYKPIFEPRLSLKLIEEPLKEIQNKRSSIIFDKQNLSSPIRSPSQNSPIRSKRQSRNSLPDPTEDLKEIRCLLLQKLSSIKLSTSEKKLNVSQPNSNQISPQASFELVLMNQKRNDIANANWSSLDN